MYYLASQPSSSYYYRTYFDWMGDFVVNFINYVSVEDKKREQLKLEIEQIGKYLKDIGEFIDKSSKQSFYKSVITGRIEEKKVVQTIMIEEEKVEILISEYEVYCL